jgi:hypothetical protein
VLQALVGSARLLQMAVEGADQLEGTECASRPNPRVAAVSRRCIVRGCRYRYDAAPS